jgi:hypothetical protein
VQEHLVAADPNRRVRIVDAVGVFLTLVSPPMLPVPQHPTMVTVKVRDQPDLTQRPQVGTDHVRQPPVPHWPAEGAP